MQTSSVPTDALGTPAEPWPAPRALAPVHATVPMAGSKSVTNRALVLAALADGPSVLRAPLISRDTRLMAAALRAMGVGVDDDRRRAPGGSRPASSAVRPRSTAASPAR